ncbi:MAG: hypothetical protein PHX57_02120 [Desulfobulbaceae bacterium]|nr:hypothetical protein [Desulfobulbaceae bacterium]
MTLSSEQWPVIGWDGITVRVPPQWQPTVILRDYLFFEDEGRPVLEMKWRHAGRRFAPDRVLKKIGKTFGQGGAALRKWSLPPALEELLQPFAATGFACREGSLDSRGLLLFCPACGRATLLRFHDNPGEERTMSLVLSSFRDHADGDDLLWAVYDIRAVLPAAAKLRAHEFLVGRFTLTFSLDDSDLTLLRFKPAAALLNNRDLCAFGASLADPARPAGPVAPDSCTWVEEAGGPKRLLRRLQKKPLWTWLKLWHIADENVILGAKGEGKRGAPGSTIMEDIRRRYTARPAA